jgi:hypothetical protein
LPPDARGSPPPGAPANLNVSVRILSPGDEGPVEQAAAVGGNVNVGVRILSPGDTGAVVQIAAPGAGEAASTATPSATRLPPPSRPRA